VRDLAIEHHQALRSVLVLKMEQRAVNVPFGQEVRKLVFQRPERSVAQIIANEGPDNFVMTPSKQRQPGVIDFEDISFNIQGLVGQRRFLVQIAEAAFALAQSGFNPPTLGVLGKRGHGITDVLRHFKQ